MYKIEDQTKFYNSKAKKTGWRDFISPDFINLPSCQAAQLPNFRNRKAIAFTMAEILISLTIIGVIAAITVPSLKANINEKTWATQKKALYSRMSQAISMLPSLNGYGIVMNENGTVNETETASKAAQTFITDGLSKVLKINNICDSTNLNKCGIPSKITVMKTNSKIDFPTNLTELNPMFTSTYTDSNNKRYTNPQKNINTLVTAFETTNGESIAVFYNPLCLNFEQKYYSGSRIYSQPWMCANFLYDLNGRKGPNKMGKDIGFITALYPTESVVVAPLPFDKNLTGGDYSGIMFTEKPARKACTAKGGRIPTLEELAAMFYNRSLTQIYNNMYFARRSSNNEKYFFYSSSGHVMESSNGTYGYVRCIKR